MNTGKRQLFNWAIQLFAWAWFFKIFLSLFSFLFLKQINMYALQVYCYIVNVAVQNHLIFFFYASQNECSFKSDIMKTRWLILNSGVLPLRLGRLLVDHAKMLPYPLLDLKKRRIKNYLTSQLMCKSSKSSA